MELNNFLDLLSQFKKHYKWTGGECIISFSKDLEHVYTDRVFFPRPSNTYDYIMPLLLVEDERPDPFLQPFGWRFFGCYNNMGEPCVVRIFIGGSIWELKSVEIFRDTRTTLGRLGIQFENEVTKDIREIVSSDILGNGAFAKELFAQIRKKLSE